MPMSWRYFLITISINILDLVFYLSGGYVPMPFKKTFYWSIVALQCCVSFLLCSKVNQSYVYIYTLFLRFPSHLGQHRALSRVPCVLYSRFSLVIYFIHSSVYMSVPISQFIPPSYTILGKDSISLFLFYFIFCIVINFFACWNNFLLFYALISTYTWIWVPKSILFVFMPVLHSCYSVALS